VAAAIVIESFGFNQKSRVETVRVAASNASNPITTPAPTSVSASRNTSQITSPRMDPNDPIRRIDRRRIVREWDLHRQDGIFGMHNETGDGAE